LDKAKTYGNVIEEMMLKCDLIIHLYTLIQQRVLIPF